MLPHCTSQAMIFRSIILLVCSSIWVYAWMPVIPVRMNPTNTLHPIRIRTTTTTTIGGDNSSTGANPVEIWPLHAAAAASEGRGEKNNTNKRKRRRKKQPSTIQVTSTTTAPQLEKTTVIREDIGAIDDDDDNQSLGESLTPQDIAAIADVARFEFQKDKEFSMGTTAATNAPDSNNNNPSADDAIATAASTQSVTPANAIPLPDIKEARKRKQMEEELAKIEQEQEANKVKIKRSDKEAFRKLLEQQPFADADDSYFEEEEYGPVSALLGERAKPFLSIPSGPLQVGHFIGALGIVLMAFVEYPGFPLTNLPTPLRDCLQGGLGTIYAINTILAVLAVFKAKERGQPVALWAAKTFSVGGLAYDQLTQLPTLEEVERSKSIKGKRALKKRKK